MSQFDVSFKITMANEGGYSHDPDDAGGETYAGIARNYWAAWLGWHTIDQIKAQKPANLNQAFKADANLQLSVQSFYKTNFWDQESLDGLNDQQTANQVFDTAVNMGTGIAAKTLQEAVNNVKPNTLVVDGAVGPKTIAVANGLNAQSVYNAFCQLRKNRYEAIIKAKPSQAKFANSWFSRILPYKTIA